MVLISSLFYLFRSSAMHISEDEYLARYPVYEGVVVAYDIFVLDNLTQFVLFAIVAQIEKYKATSNTNQGISGITAGVLLTAIGFSLALMIQEAYGYKRDIDVREYLWFAAQLLRCFQFFPQLFMNWFDSCVIGTHRLFFPLHIISTMLLITGKALIRDPWHAVPQNYDTWPDLVFVSIAMAVYARQFFAYRGHSPSLPLKYQ